MIVTFLKLSCQNDPLSRDPCQEGVEIQLVFDVFKIHAGKRDY